MTDFVLIPGAWMGGWAWEAVTDELTGRGHRVHPVTLPGLEDDGDPTTVGLKDHVDHVVTLIEREGLSGVVVVGHSYAGIVAGMVADRLPETVAHTVFVDSNLPVDGKSMVDGFSAQGRDGMLAALAASGGRWFPPGVDDLKHGQDFTLDQVTALVGRSRPHPGGSITEPAELRRPLDEQRATFIQCTKANPQLPPAAAALRDAPKWTFARLDTGHWPMVTAAPGLAEILAGAGVD